MRVDAFRNSIAAELEARGFNAVTADVWKKAIAPEIAIGVQPRLTVCSNSVWVEFGLGVRFDAVEKLLIEATSGALPDRGESFTLGCDLRHLIDTPNDSGWTYSPRSVFLRVGLAEMIERLDNVAMPMLLRYSTWDALRRLVGSRMVNNREDPFIFREHHYIPIVLLLNEEYDLCSKYIEHKLGELASHGGSSSQALTGYANFAHALMLKVNH